MSRSTPASCADKYYVVDDYQPVVLIQKRAATDVADAACAIVYVREMLLEVLAAGRRVSCVFDSLSTHVATAGIRRELGQFLETNHALVRNACVGLHAVFYTPAARASLTAVEWMYRFPLPVQTHTERECALRLAALENGRSREEAADISGAIGRRLRASMSAYPGPA